MSDIAVLQNVQDYGHSISNRIVDLTTIPMQTKRNPNLVKWNVLFDKKGTEWISFKPKLGLYAYACYACRNMFGSKNSFLDHVNRRGMLLKYKCSYCTQQPSWTFYNPCSFLLHTRQHYTLLDGEINLESLEISMLPYGLAGFLPNPNIPMLYNVDDDNIGETVFINSRFYSPKVECMGNAIIKLASNELLFYHADDTTREITSLALKQISCNIPRCRFILLECSIIVPAVINNQALQLGESCIVSIKDEQQNASLRLKKAESNNSEIRVQTDNTAELQKLVSRFTKCPECHQAQSVTMSEHFIQTNQPFLKSLQCMVCNYIAPSKCSLEAHKRIHENEPPYVCPECGRRFPQWEQLHSHMNEVCFHLTKQVRIRCTSKRCGKIFAQMVTFAAHFRSHLKELWSCVTCNHIVVNELDFLQHSAIHDVKELPAKIYHCVACNDSEETFGIDEIENHIQQHAVNKYLYVYVCKCCHSYFRSPGTYATHLLRCSKTIPPQVNPYLLSQRQSMAPHCPKCQTEIAPHLLNQSHICRNCNSYISLTSDDDSSSETDNIYCPLCDCELLFSEIEEHTQNQCKYSKPIVPLQDCKSLEEISIKEEVCGLDFGSDTDSYKNKRRKTTTIDEFPSESYLCKFCIYTTEVRSDYHNHIIFHHNLAAPYQCMECSECFATKLLLSKHLVSYHKINDTDKYFEKNDCYDRLSEFECTTPSAPFISTQCK